MYISDFSSVFEKEPVAFELGKNLRNLVNWDKTTCTI